MQSGTAAPSGFVQVGGLQQVVVVEEQAELALHAPQAEVGGPRAAQSTQGASPPGTCVRPPVRQRAGPAARQGGRALRVLPTTGVDDNDLDIGVGLRSHTGDGVCQRG